MFVFLMLVMFLLATTELGTDGWIQDIMGTVLKDPIKGTLFLVYTAAIMFVLRFFAGPIVHRISPLGLLAAVRRDRGRRPVLARQRGHERRHAVPRRHAVRRRQDVLLADDAGRRLGTISTRRGAAPQCHQRRRHDRRRHDRRPGHRHAAGPRLQPGRGRSGSRNSLPGRPPTRRACSRSTNSSTRPSSTRPDSPTHNELNWPNSKRRPSSTPWRRSPSCR